MRRCRKTILLTSFCLTFFLLGLPAVNLADEETITLQGRVDTSSIGISPGTFEVRALRPQDRSVEMAEATTDNQGRFSLKVEEETLALYGAVIVATSLDSPSVVLEAPVLRLREAKEPIEITPATTVEAAVLHWKVLRDGEDFDLVRPFRLLAWLKPLLEPKARKGLNRAEVALASWASSIASKDGLNSSTVLKAAVGDVRKLRSRLGELRVSSEAIEEVEQMVQTDAEVAYLVIMPYILEL